MLCNRYIYRKEFDILPDGIDDEIDYEYDEIMKEMKQFILDQCQLVKKEAELIEVLKTVLNDD